MNTKEDVLTAAEDLMPHCLTPEGVEMWKTEYLRDHPPNPYECDCGTLMVNPQHNNKNVDAYCPSCGRLKRKKEKP